MFASEINKLLNLVSRSFTLCIPRLPKQVRNEVGNFYLLCRYADSIEDSKISFTDKKKYFKRYLTCLKQEDLNKMNTLSAELTPKILNKNDQKMFKRFSKVFKQFVGFDEKSKKIALKWLKEMTKGMAKYSKKEIENFLDLDNYCYYVAGTVGFYITQITDHKFNLHKYDFLLSKCEDFGLLLQKVNIIRDFSKDYENGKTFWPKSLFKKHNMEIKDAFKNKNDLKRKQILSEMIKSTEPHIKNTLEYLKNLPAELKFVWAIPFYMAIPTLLKCYGNDEIFDPQKKVKIGKIQTTQIISSLNKKISSEQFFEEYLIALNEKNSQGLNLNLQLK